MYIAWELVGLCSYLLIGFWYQRPEAANAAIEGVIDEVMARNPGQLADYRAGKDKLFGFFVGQVMKATGGKANPAQLNELLLRKLK
jgi:Asp-tRNA(Asn)/Glu-tRNA(Gln) amidotransferase B subunit